MPERALLTTLRHALHTLLDLDDEPWCEPYQRWFPLTIDEAETALWRDLPCADDPPQAWRLSTRSEGGHAIHELWWCPDPDLPPGEWPVVEIDADGETAVTAANVADWVDALLHTGGQLAGGTDEDLETAAEEATDEGRALSEDLVDELDREPPGLVALADRWEEAQERWFDAWAERVEAVD